MAYNEIKRLQQLAGIITEISINKPKTKLDYPYINNNPFDSLEDVEIAWDELEQEVEERMGNIGTITNKLEKDYYGTKFWYIVARDFQEKYGHDYQDLIDYFDQFRKKIDRK